MDAWEKNFFTTFLTWMLIDRDCIYRENGSTVFHFILVSNIRMQLRLLPTCAIWIDVMNPFRDGSVGRCFRAGRI